MMKTCEDLTILKVGRADPGQCLDEELYRHCLVVHDGRKVSCKYSKATPFLAGSGFDWTSLVVKNAELWTHNKIQVQISLLQRFSTRDPPVVHELQSPPTLAVDLAGWWELYSEWTLGGPPGLRTTALLIQIPAQFCDFGSQSISLLEVLGT